VDRFPWWPFHWSDAITFAGLLLTVNEALFHHGGERPGLQFMYLCMMGIGPAARIDERRQQHKREREEAERRGRSRRKTDR
jgi:hypothetical protein